MKNTILASSLKSLVLASIFVVLVAPAHSETIVGRWCDKMIPTMPQFNNTMTIVLNDMRDTVLKRNFADGSSKIDTLHELPNGIYEKSNSAQGDKYKIKPNNGDLQLLDNDGLIRIAKRLENTQKSGECN